ncbi:MAG TPA: FHA domain-containing protein, partial [Ilumatobacteraceae bacterium]|nr:FHA domain-containing protein [Ilumatobacteraceae bacterium]
MPVDDAALSREHVRIAITQVDGGLTITVYDAGSRNGTFVDGERLTRGKQIALGQPVEAGHSLFRLERMPVVNQPSSGSTSKGVVAFNRPPRMRPKSPDRIFQLAAPPDKPEKRKVPTAGIIGPLVLGLPMVILGPKLMKSPNGGPNMLVILGAISMVGSLLMAGISFFEDRRTGRGAYRHKRVGFYDDLKELADRITASTKDETLERRRLSPNAAELADRSSGPTPQLWERRPDDADFLCLSVGWADQPSTSQVEFAEGGDDALRQEANSVLNDLAIVHNVPIVLDLQRFGVAGVSGEASAIGGLGRWLLVQLAALHSPRDVVISVAVAADESTEWSWVSWLPHTRSDSSPIEGNHLAVGEMQASSLFETLNGVIRARRDDRGTQLAASKKPSPAVVLVVSERLRVPRSAVTRLLEEGAGVGVYVIWLGSRREELPGECGAI